MSRFFSFSLLMLLACALLSLNAAEAESYRPPEGRNLSIAVFSPENLSGGPVPLKEIREALISGLTSSGFSVVDDATLERFMDRHRIRYAGGIDDSTAAAMKKEEKIDAVLIASVELCDERIPPKIAIIARLVSTAEGTEILWMDSVAAAGDDAPGLLNLGLINDPAVLREKVVERLIGSLLKHLAGSGTGGPTAARRYGPKLFYRSAAFPWEGKRYRVAVIPFLNLSEKKYGSEIMLLHFVSALVMHGGFNVIEPGVVRQRLLNMRITMPYGISLLDADRLFLSLDTDLLVDGKIYDYQDYSGPEGVAKVYFLTEVLEKKAKKVVWTSESDNRGDDGVFFFDQGRVNVAGRLAAYMARSVVNEMLQNEEKSPASPVVSPFSLQSAK
jgi:hypothetical protein